IDMLDFDIFWGPTVWPEMRETVLKVRRLQPNVMIRARGIGNYGDYYTPEDFVPSSKATTEMPWFVIYPLGKPFSYDPDPANYKGAKWIVHNLVDVTAKGGNFMVGAGPDGAGNFHPTAVSQMKEAGKWLKVNGEGIYATRPRPGSLWTDGKSLRFTRTKDNQTIYCFTLEWPGVTLTVPSLERDQVKSVRMLGYPEELKFNWDATRGLVIQIPESLQQASNRPADFVWGFRLSQNG
ncbi:MAG TPA: alpha-L-fucosidase, partial [Terracidiphilus sp.]